MPKAERGTPKDIAKRIKAKGLQKLKFYCQMCAKQCRDENGFRCHLTSDSHLRQMKIFSDNATGILDQFSQEFETFYLETLRRRHGTKRVNANGIYQEVIQDKHHIHMNATKWVTLSDFVQYLGKSGKCTVDETERGWYVQYIQRDPVLLARQEALQKRVEAEKREEERTLKRMELKRVQAAKMLDRAGGVINIEATNIQRNDNDKKVEISLGLTNEKKKKKTSLKRPVDVLDNADDDVEDEDGNVQDLTVDKRKKEENCAIQTEGRKKSRWGPREQSNHNEKIVVDTMVKSVNQTDSKNVRTIDHEGGQRDKVYDSQNILDVRKENWIQRDILVRIISKKTKFYKRKAVITKVVDKYTAKLEILDSSADKNDGGHVIKLDQKYLESVIPSIGKSVLILNGPGRGMIAELLETDKKKFRGKLKLIDSGIILKKVDFEDFSKIMI